MEHYFNKITKLGALGTAILLMNACTKQNPSYSLLPDSNSFKQQPSVLSNKLDILWVMDNSYSMHPLQTNLLNNFNSFISDFKTKNYDFKMAVTTTDAYLAAPFFQNNDVLFAKFKDGTDQTSHSGVFVITPITPNLNNVFVINANQGEDGSGDERAFSSFKQALQSPSNTGFLRSNSFFAIIIVSDEDDFSDPTRIEGSWVYRGKADHSYSNPTLETVDSYVSYLDTLTATSGSTRRYNVSSIAVLDSACLTAHLTGAPSSIIGQRYKDIANKTSGTLGSVCDTSFANSLNAIQNHIAELSTQFILSRTPVVSTIVVTVNDVGVAQDAANGWTYDSGANAIVFHGSAIPPQNATISVNFDPVTVK